MTLLIPVLINPGDDKKPRKRSKKTMAKKKVARKSWVASARKAGAVTARGKVMTKAAALSKGIRVPGFITPTEARQHKSAASTAKRRSTAWKKLTGGGRAPAVSPKTKSWRARKGYTRGRSYSKGTAYASKSEPIKWTEAAAASGAVYPAGHARAGRPMSKNDALRYQRPVVGFLTRGMISGFYDRVLEGGAVTKKKAKFTQAQTWLKEQAKKLGTARRKRASPWKRSPQYYTKSGKAPGGKAFKKGARKPDYKQSWGSKAKFQREGAAFGGKYLRVKHRKGRGPVARPAIYRGWSPSQAEIFELESGGFAGPLSAPGGNVQLNRPKRRKARKTRRRPSATRTATGRFKKRRNPKARRKVAANKRRKPRRKKRNPKLKVYNNSRPKRRRKARRNPRRKAVKRNYGYRRKKVATNKRRKPARRRRRKVSANKRRVRRNGYLAAQLASVQSMSFYTGVAGLLVGAGGTFALSNMALRSSYLAGWAYEPGLMGHAKRLAVRGGSAILVSAAAELAKPVLGNQAGKAALAGGAAYAIGSLLLEATPLGQWLGMGMGMSAMGPMGGMGGMGSVLSPRQLVEGESAARLSTEFSGMNDWLTLSGLGQPVPIEDLRGYPGQYGGGMSDWVEFKPDSGFVADNVFDPAEQHF